MWKSLQLSTELIVSGIYLPVVPVLLMEFERFFFPVLLDGMDFFRNMWNQLPRPEQQIAQFLQSFFQLSA